MAHEQISGQITVTTAGTAIDGAATTGATAGIYAFSAAPGNTGTTCYIGNDGADDVAATTGFGIQKNDIVYISISGATGFAGLYFDSDTNGDKIDWIRVGTPTMAFPPSA